MLIREPNFAVQMASQVHGAGQYLYGIVRRWQNVLPSMSVKWKSGSMPDLKHGRSNSISYGIRRLFLNNRGTKIPFYLRSDPQIFLEWSKRIPQPANMNSRPRPFAKCMKYHCYEI